MKYIVTALVLAATIGCAKKSVYRELVGPAGPAGAPGEPGTPGLDTRNPGLSCNVHDLSNWDGVSNIITALENNPAVGNFTLDDLSVGDSPASAGFPGMPADIQDAVGVEGYALDCYGFLAIDTSGNQTFRMLSDDGVRLVIQDQVVINDPSLHAPSTAVATRELQRGPNKINVIYYQGPQSQIALELRSSGPNHTDSVIPASSYTN